MDIRLKVKNITPIAQIEGSKKSRVKELGDMEVDEITVKTITKLEDGIPVNIPIYTANGLRGLLRREASSILVEKYLENGGDIKAEDFHLMFAGGGNNFQTQPFDVELKVRELNPVISVFGTSLAIEGKLIVTHLEPENPVIRIQERENGEVYGYSELVRRMIFTKKDDILQKTTYGRFLTKEDIIKWEEEVNATQMQRRAERNKDADLVEKKTKKVAIQAVLAKSYIIPNVLFKGFIGEKDNLTDIEKGLLIKALERLVNKQLGSTQNLGFGICDWEISLNNTGSKIIAKTDEENFFKKNINLVLSDEDESYVKKFEDWLESISNENIEISKVLIRK